MNKNNIFFSIFVVAYYKLDFLKTCINSILSQSYNNFELLVIDNGSIKEVSLYINSLKDNPKIKIIKYDKNQFSWDDPLMQIHTCWNRALKESSGEYITSVGADDMISKNFFHEFNSILSKKKCLTIAPNIKEINEFNHEINIINMNNNRDKFIDGKFFLLGVINKTINFNAPGEIFTIRTDFLKKYAGYHRNVEMDHLYGVVPNGLTAYASRASIYWRRHGSNLGNQLPQKGFSTLLLYKKWIFDRNIEILLQKNFTIKEIKKIQKNIISQGIKLDCLNIAENIYSFNLTGSFKIFRKIFIHPFSWIYLFIALYHRKSVVFNYFK